MALSAQTAWEVRPTNGSDTNGGGFVAGSTGTDWSTQNAAQYAKTDIVTNGTTTITSATSNWGTDVVGNIIYIAGGTGSLAGVWRQIVTRVSASNLTLDASTGLAASTGCTGNVGGALQTITAVLPTYVASNKIFVKAEATITTAASFTFAQGAVPGNATPLSRVIGYTNSRTDNGRVSITLSTNSALTALNDTSNGVSFENFNIDCASLTTSTGIALGEYGQARNCKVANVKTAGISTNGQRICVFGNEVTGGITGATGGINALAQSSQIVGNWVHDNVCPGIVCQINSGNVIAFNLVTNNSGASSDGIQCAPYGNCVFGNTVYNSGRSGIRPFSGAFGGIGGFFRNNILEGNAAFGIDFTTAGWCASPLYDGNAYYNNTSGARGGMDDAGTTNKINGVSPYVNVLDVLNTTGSFFTNAAGGDFTINSIANRGALIRGTGWPGAIVGVSQVGYQDFGVFRHQDPAGGAGGGHVLQSSIIQGLGAI
jgi:hypothetical protein